MGTGNGSSFPALAAVAELQKFEALVSALGAPAGRQLVSGLWGAASGLVLAALVERTRRPLLVLSATPEDADRLETDISTFLGRRVLPLPAYDVLPGEAEEPELPVLSARVAALRRLADGGEPSAVVVAPVGAILQPLPSRDALQEGEFTLKTGQAAGFARLVEWLASRGLARVPAVGGRGEFAVRGGIVDVFPLCSVALGDDQCPERAEERPFRIEFDGDVVASLRTFDPATQRSVAEIKELRIPGIELSKALDPYTFGRLGSVAEYLPGDAIVAVVEPAEVERSAGFSEASRFGASAGQAAWKEVREALETRAVLEIARTPTGAGLEFDVTSVQRASGRAEEVASRLRQMAERLAALTIFCRDAAEESRLLALLARSGSSSTGRIEARRGRISAGFEFRELAWAALADHEVLGVTSEHRRTRPRAEGEPISDFLELSAGDYVVHATHGVARYLGMKTLEKPGGTEDFLTLLFADNVRLYVPVAHAYLVERYVGSGDARPPLSRIGGSAWARRRSRAERAVRDIAADLLKTQAERARVAGLACPGDSSWQAEFEAAFPYEETPDQLAATEALKRDMERPVPMDRLLCGDVGFGKTEVAMRAAFKAVAAGRQVAVLVPTTLLAEQHAKTFADRFAGYPVAVASLSRFKTRSEQKELLRDLREGRLDIVIGTHRLLADDVQFRDLGLIVIDEEHRFGVEHKEALKKMRLAAHVLSLSATPIPRTLHMSLVGLRDISSLTIPPEDRLSIRTKVCRFSPELVRRAVLRELARGGQVYFVHDRVLDIDALASRLGSIVPEARLGVIHGRLPEQELEERMGSFLARRLDMLVTTSIVESGLDIPTVNTIFVNNADRFGLAELHQLRGRVGRYRHQAYAYLLVPDERPISRDAEKRLRAVEEFEELGAGFKLAMRDLEIRGAGNLLGAEQSGHIAEVGYELYCRLLERAVRELKGERVRDPLDVTISFDWGASLPSSYVPDEPVKLELYRRIARARDERELDSLAAEMRDRLGPLPVQAERFLAEARLRLLAQRAGTSYIGRELGRSRGRLVFKMRDPEFRKIERALAGLPGSFSITGPEGFAVHLPAGALSNEKLEETTARILKRLA